MIAESHLADWRNIVPWVKIEQVEQDLIISRMLVDIFSDEFLRK